MILWVILHYIHIVIICIFVPQPLLVITEVCSSSPRPSPQARRTSTHAWLVIYYNHTYCSFTIRHAPVALFQLSSIRTRLVLRCFRPSTFVAKVAKQTDTYCSFTGGLLQSREVFLQDYTSCFISLSPTTKPNNKQQSKLQTYLCGYLQ